jgi:hypothetical protein
MQPENVASPMETNINPKHIVRQIQSHIYDKTNAFRFQKSSFDDALFDWRYISLLHLLESDQQKTLRNLLANGSLKIANLVFYPDGTITFNVAN